MLLLYIKVFLCVSDKIKSLNIISAGSYSYVAPDGGYGWIVVAASFLVNMIADGVTFSFGVMFEEFEQESVYTSLGET